PRRMSQPDRTPRVLLLRAARSLEIHSLAVLIRVVPPLVVRSELRRIAGKRRIRRESLGAGAASGSRSASDRARSDAAARRPRCSRAAGPLDARTVGILGVRT